MHGFGAILSHAAKLARRVEYLPIGAPDLGKDVDLVSHAPPVMDQSFAEGCEGCMGACLLDTALSAQGYTTSSFISPWGLWTIPRMKERGASLRAGQPAPKLTNVGVQTADMVSGYGEFGVLPMGPTNARFCDIGTTQTDFEREVDTISLQQAATRPIVGPYAIDPKSPSAGDLIEIGLHNGVPTGIILYADDAFMGIKPGQVLPVPVVTPGVNRLHAVSILGVVYTAVSRERLFLIRNSYGTGFGDNGNTFIDDAGIAASYELWPHVIKGVA